MTEQIETTPTGLDRCPECGGEVTHYETSDEAPDVRVAYPCGDVLPYAAPEVDIPEWDIPDATD